MKAASYALFFVVFGSGAPAQGPSASPSKDEQEIRAVLDHWKTAAQQRDVNGVMSIYLPGGSLVAYDLVPPLAYRGIADYRKDYEAFFAQYKGPLTIEYRDVHVIAGPKVGFSYGLEKISGTLADGSHSETWIRFTQGYQHVGGRWYAVHDHVSVPADLNTGKALLSLTP